MRPPGYPIPVQPMGIINTPYDLVVLIVFGVAMFAWGYFSGIRPRPAPIVVVAPPAAGALPASPRT